MRKPKPVPQQPIPAVDSAKNFPPLPSMTVAERSKNGYSGDEYIRYKKRVVLDAYAAIVKSGLSRPSDMPSEIDVLRTEPHAEMVLMSPPSEGIPVVVDSADSAESVMEFSFAEAAITARDIKTPEISNEHLLPHRKRRNSNVKPSDMVGRKRGDSRGVAPPSSPAASSGLIRPEPHRPEPKKPIVVAPTATAAPATAAASIVSSDASEKPKKKSADKPKKVTVAPTTEKKDAAPAVHAEVNKAQPSTAATSYADRKSVV